MKKKLTKEEAMDLILDNNKDPEEGIEYLNGLEDESGCYELKDVERYINR